MSTALLASSGVVIGILFAVLSVAIIVAVAAMMRSGAGIQERTAVSLARSVPGVATIEVATAEPYSEANTHFPSASTCSSDGYRPADPGAVRASGHEGTSGPTQQDVDRRLRLISAGKFALTASRRRCRGTMG